MQPDLSAPRSPHSGGPANGTFNLRFFFFRGRTRGRTRTLDGRIGLESLCCTGGKCQVLPVNGGIESVRPIKFAPISTGRGRQGTLPIS